MDRQIFAILSLMCAPDQCHEKNNFIFVIILPRDQAIEMVIDSPYSAARECFGPIAHSLYSGF